MFFQRSWNDNIISPTESKLLAMFLPYFLTLSDDVKPQFTPLIKDVFDHKWKGAIPYHDKNCPHVLSKLLGKAL